MRVELRKTTIADTPLLVRWRNADREFFLDSEPLNEGAHRAWYTGTYVNAVADHLYLVICDGLPAGTAGITVSGGRGEIGRMLLGDKALARQGVMSAALRLVTDGYGLRGYWLRVLKGNEPAIAFYQRNGFTVARAADRCLVMERGRR